MADKPAQPNPDDGSFVDRIVTDPNNVPDVMLLYGYPGASSEEGHERLYLGADLAKFVEIPTSAILHRAPTPREQDPHGGMTLWVRKDAALIQRMAPGTQALAHFFAGAIQAQGAAAAAGPAAGIPAFTFGGPACGVTLPAVCQIATAFCTRDSCGIACTLGGPVCGVTLPAVCQVASAVCTRDTCGIACTAAGPCLTRGADCQTQAATCACTEVGCPTDITPCINTHVVTCGACPSVIAVCQSVGFACQTGGGDCTFIGCGHTLACTQGLLCAAPQQARAAAVPEAAPPQTQVCGPGPQPTVVGTCQPCVSFNQICASINPTCAPFCTQLGCITVAQNCQTPFLPCVTVPPGATCGPQCTIAGPCRSPFVPCVTQVCTIPPQATCNARCTIIGPGCQVFTPGCPPFTPACPPLTPACPPFTPACPPFTPVCGPESLACVPDSLACGPGQPGPGPLAARMAMPTQAVNCTNGWPCTVVPWACGQPCATGTVM